MKKITLIVTFLFVSGLVYANCGNGGDNGNGCSGNSGSQGPQGPEGPAGKDGQNGVNGTNGTNGTNGNNGVNGAIGPQNPIKSMLIAGLEVRLFDTKRLSLFAFDDYQLDPQPSHDLFSGARNNSYGARLVIKLGSSYEEREIEKLRNELKGHNVIELPE